MKRMTISIFSGHKTIHEDRSEILISPEPNKKVNELKVKCVDCGTIYDYDSEDIFPFNINNSSDSEIIYGVCRNCSAEKIQTNLKKISDE